MKSHVLAAVLSDFTKPVRHLTLITFIYRIGCQVHPPEL